MRRTARSAMFLFGLVLALAGLSAMAPGGSAELGLLSVAMGGLLIARSGIVRSLPLAVAIVLLVLAARVLVVAVPSPVDWPMLAAASLAVLTALALLRSRGGPPLRRL